MFRKDNLFVAGWLFLPIMFLIAPFIPEEIGKENGFIENLQLLQLAVAFAFCVKQSNTKAKLANIGLKYLWYAGAIFFFLLFMREISWGRALFHHINGDTYEYSDMGLYGKLVKPVQLLLSISLFYCFYKCRIWKLVPIIKFPLTSTLLLIILVAIQYFGEHKEPFFFNGLVAEELSECACYIMMFYVVHNVSQEIQKNLT